MSVKSAEIVAIFGLFFLQTKVQFVSYNGIIIIYWKSSKSTAKIQSFKQSKVKLLLSDKTSTVANAF